MYFAEFLRWFFGDSTYMLMIAVLVAAIIVYIVCSGVAKLLAATREDMYYYNCDACLRKEVPCKKDMDDQDRGEKLE